MNDEAVSALARRAGLAVEWRDYANKKHRVSSETLRRILAALGLPCDTADDLAHSREQLRSPGLPPLMTGTTGEPIELPIGRDRTPASVRVTVEGGAVMQIRVRPGRNGAQLAGIGQPGYHLLELDEQRTILSVAPPRCFTLADATPPARLWGLAVQTYSLRSSGDCGVGDMAGVAALARNAATFGADALALSPFHALFAADATHYSPYAPSTRLFYNPIYADPRSLFGEARVQKATAQAGADAASAEFAGRPLIDWPASVKIKMSVLRRLFEDFSSHDLAVGSNPLALDFSRFREAGGGLLQDHAVFEALYAVRVAADPSAWNWRNWPEAWRHPRTNEVASVARAHRHEILFHCFLQWVADRSLAAAQQAARQAGMRVGLIADLAVGMSSAGSHAWTNQQDILGGLEIGAPPDLYNRKGQNWGLTTFSPRALCAGGFAPFIATVRACLRHCGGVRIDHAMGFLRLWVIPRGAEPHEGAYLAYPLDDLLRLIALESHRHRAIVIGEDLGTVPAGFRGRLAKAGIYGMRVLWFERRRNQFIAPQDWLPDTVAMTSTHDLPTVAGWWRGHDIETRRQLQLVRDAEDQRAVRQKERRRLWRAFTRSQAACGEPPAPNETEHVADAAMNFIAQTRSQLTLAPLEDVLALEDQPNLPGTIDEHPNWRRRYPGEAENLLEPPEIRRRLEPLMRRGDR